MSNSQGSVSFAPELFINKGVTDLSFYEHAFGAVERRRFANEDDSVHAAEFSIGETIFHVHEVTAASEFVSPGLHKGTTVCIGLFVPDVDAMMGRAIEAGALEIQAAQDHAYGYRQGMIQDPFGHYWQIQKKTF
jgi:PhnB protein